MPIIMVGFDRASWRVNNLANVCTGGTPFGSGGTTQRAWAFDGLLTGHGYGHGSSSSTLTLGYIFAAAKTISKLRLYISQGEIDGSFNAIGAFKFYGSNDTTNGSDGTWTQITTGTMNNTADTWQEYSFTEASYKAVKVVGDSSVLYPMIVEMEVYGY